MIQFVNQNQFQSYPTIRSDYLIVIDCKKFNRFHFQFKGYLTGNWNLLDCFGSNL